MRSLRPVYIIGGKRVPFVKSMTKYMGVSTQELMTASLSAVVDQFGLRGQIIGDVALGAVMNSSANWNLARECTLSSGLHPYTPAYNVQRACGTSLETAWQLGLKIAAGQINEAIAGGVDTNSDVPIEVSQGLRDLLLQLNNERTVAGRLKVLSGIRLSHLKPRTPAVVEPRTKLSMGQHTELMVKEWKIAREDQDALAYRSHISGAKAYDEGFYADLVIAFRGLTKDATLRGDTTLEKLATLKPAFDRENGSLTAGNSSPLSDGSSAVLLASEESAKAHGWTPLARLVDVQASAIDFVSGDGLLMAPTIAVARLLERNQLKLQDFDLYEIHEAFAGQVLCTLKAWESDEYCRKFLGTDRALGPIDTTKMNIVGGSVALGHPFAATGGRILATLAKLLHQNRTSGGGAPKRGLISICTAGGMGIAAILEA